MRKVLGILIALLLGAFIGWALWGRGGGGGGHGASTCGPKEVNVLVDSTYKYHLAINQKTLHLSLGSHDFAFWTFDQDTTVDSVTAVFSPSSPFASSRFEFSDSAAFSGPPVVAAGPTVYTYVLTVYPHAHAPVTVDPGIIIDM
jgi:hypothetical protein